MTLALPACAQAPKATRAANEADPALWVVKDKDTTIYLFGTIHVLKPGMTWFDEAVKTAFDRSQQVVLELVMPDATKMQSLVMATGVSPSGPTLTEQIPAAKRAAYAKAVTDLGLPANAFDRFKPWLAATNLSIAPLSKLGYDAANGPEQIITAAAKAAGKPVIGLETAEQQLGYFGNLSQGAQMEFLSSTIDELPKLETTMATMVDEWAKGDPEALAREMNDSLKDSPEVAKVLLVDRNKHWANWVAERMKTPGTVFVAVGAGHLAGKDSVQAQLAKLGVKAQRVQY
ncbi:TraB/GumN family protein [Sphingomonas sp. R86521]|uniref:TraB/GumN family protein n=1 Tax=Sphingomonas sp. R86521 TaxID=3093860 RepID=UPI0036D2E81D